jgi:hypothetical protein
VKTVLAVVVVVVIVIGDRGGGDRDRPHHAGTAPSSAIAEKSDRRCVN